MLEIESIGEMIKEREKLDGKSVGLVPTMGYLHEGHLSLVEAAKQECDVVVMSIFVNPLQFGPEEDFDRYPRDLERDQRLAREHGVDILFVPQAEEMYPKKPAATVKVTGITEVLCGKSRPGHFDGVATVVMKLFQLVRPRRAYFGQKDAQQVAVIHRMAEDLNVPVEIVACPIVREKDGLAMSSRNVYLTEEERAPGRDTEPNAAAYERRHSVEGLEKCRGHKRIHAQVDRIDAARFPRLCGSADVS